jgi:hypothetical protein
MAKSGTITVKFGKLTEPLQRLTTTEGTNLGDFLKRRSMELTSSIRVNGETATAETVLRNGAVITDIDNVDGGSN